jgi:hypothetical protein
LPPRKKLTDYNTFVLDGKECDDSVNNYQKYVEILKEMRTIEGKKAFRKLCHLPNCLKNDWELKPFYDENEERNISEIKAGLYALDRIVRSY